MPWAIKFESLALKELQRLEKPTRYRIERFLNELTNNPNPRARGIALQGEKYKDYGATGSAITDSSAKSRIRKSLFWFWKSAIAKRFIANPYLPITP
jgi:hypothetical protein